MIKRYGIFFIFVLFGFNVFAESQKESVIVFQNESDLLLIGKQIYFLKDKEKKLEIEDILKPEIQAKFQLNPRDVFIRRPSDSAFWLKLNVENQSKKDAWIELGSIYLWYIDYYVQEGEKYKLHTQTGILRPEEKKAYPSNLFWLPLGNAFTKQTVYARIYTQRPIDIPIHVGSMLSLNKNESKHNFIKAAFIGLMLLIFFYNLFLFFTIKDIAYFVYIIHVIFLLPNVLYAANYPVYDFLFGGKAGQFLHRYPYTILGINYATATYFIIVFLNLQKSLIIKTILYFFIFFNIALFPILEFFEIVKHSTLVPVFQIINNINIFFLLGIGLYEWLVKKNKNARFYCLAWTIAIVSVSCYFLTINGIIEYNFFNRNFIVFGVATETVLFSLALGDRFNTLREEKSKIEHENLVLVQNYNKELEEGIRQKTLELVVEVEQRKQSEKILQDFKDALDTHVIVAITDTKGKITYVNQQFMDISQYSQEELIGKDHRIINSNYHSREHIKELWKTIQSGKVWKGDFRNLAKDGSFYWVNSTIFPFLDSDGKPTQYIALRTDITKQKKIEEDLRLAKEKADSANRAKTEFLANMSHEIRTPINAVLGFTEILQARLEDESNLSFLNSILMSGKILLRLINDFLDLSKIEAGKIELIYKPVRLDSIYEEMNMLFSHKIEEKKLQLLLQIDDEMPPVLILDEVRLRQVFLNLIGNAIKFTDKGYISVFSKSQLLEGKQNFINLEIKVADTGIGINKSEQEEIFESFTQVKGQDTKKYGGTGLGLAISKKLVHLMNGEIHLESEFGKGTTFTIVLREVEIAKSFKKTKIETRILPKNNEEKSEENKKETSHNFSDLQIKRLKGLYKILSEEKVNICKSLQDVIVIDDVLAFSKDMLGLGTEYEYQKLISWAKDLERYTSIYDIEGINRILNRFSDLVEELRTIAES